MDLLRSWGIEMMEEPTLRILDGRLFFGSTGDDGLVEDGDDGRDASSHARGGADKLLLLIPFIDRVRRGNGETMLFGTGSLTNSGRLSNARGSSICILSSIGSGIASRMNSGNDSIASGSFSLCCAEPGGERTASWECSRPASECRASCSTNASRCKRHWKDPGHKSATRAHLGNIPLASLL